MPKLVKDLEIATRGTEALALVEADPSSRSDLEQRLAKMVRVLQIWEDERALVFFLRATKKYGGDEDPAFRIAFQPTIDKLRARIAEARSRL